MRWWLLVLAVCACNQGVDLAKNGSAVAAAPPAIVVHDAAAVVPDAPPPPALELVGCKPAELPPRLATATYGGVGRGVLGRGYPQGAGNVDSLSNVLGNGGQGAPAISQVGSIGSIGGGRMAPRSSDGDRPSFTLDSLNVQGDLDKNIITRFIKRNQPKLYYCFEKTLLVHPNLENGGPVSVQFFIAPDGTVATANAGGLDPELDNCVSQVLRSIEYPKPKGGGGVAVHARFVYGPPPHDTRGGIIRDAPANMSDVTTWTPYAAADTLAPADAANKAATAVETALRGQLGKPAACLKDQTGSLRAMFKLDKTGAVKSVRAGGFGEREPEACIEAALGSLAVEAPAAEVACDFKRGDTRPWRVAMAGGYTVLEVTDTDVLRDGKPIKSLTGVDRTKTAFLIVVGPSVPAGAIAPALAMTGESAATLVALRSEAGPPVWIAMARDGRSYDGDGEARRPVIDTRGDKPRVCVDGKPLDSIAALADSCAKTPCATITLGVDKKTDLHAAEQAADAARAAGLTRILFSLDTRCGS